MCSQQAMKQMIEKNIAGQIIHISSISAHWPLVGSPPIFNIYSPTKFAVKTITEVMRQELAHNNLKIRVSVSIVRITVVARKIILISLHVEHKSRFGGNGAF